MTRHVRLVAPADSGWGEMTLAIRIAKDLREAGFSIDFQAAPRFGPLLAAQDLPHTGLPDVSGPALVDALRAGLEGADAWILVDLFLGGLELMRRRVHPSACPALGPPLIGMDTWNFEHNAAGLDVLEGVLRPVEPAWQALERRLVPVPFGRMASAGACHVGPTARPSVPARVLREELGVSGPLVVLCTGWWQHRLLDERPGPDVMALVAHYLTQIPGPWSLLHIGPKPLSLRRTLGPRYHHRDTMPPDTFAATLAAADLLLSLNASATSNGTAIALGTPVLCLVQTSRARNVRELAFQLGTQPSAPLADWLRSNLPLPVFRMWPMRMVDALGRLLIGTPYGEVCNLTELLEESAVLATLRALLRDPERRAVERERQQRFLDLARALPGPAEVVAGYL